MINKAILVGNLGRDPEIRSTTSGMPVANFSLATNRRWKDRDGNRQEQTEWHNIVCFGRQAEVAGQYLSRGRQIYVEGRIQTRSWEDRNTGETRYRTEIVCDNFQMLGQRGDGGGGGGGGYQRDSYGGSGGGAPAGGSGGGAPAGGGDGSQSPTDDLGPEPEDDDIPF
ncbi:MAG: single-stranded DNA-binding protein [bacterium]|nr:single-stranded DNA-binding protein [bacterium]